MKNILTFSLALYLLKGFITLTAQNQVNTDSLFTEAKKSAKSNDYDKAEKLCKEILSIKEDGDVRFYLGLMYSWDGKYDDARRELKKVQETRPTSEEVIIARANNELWSDNSQAALEILDKALIDNPNNEEFLYLKAKALKALGRYDEAIAVLEKLLKINPNSKKAQELLNFIKVAKAKNKLSANYVNDFFDSGQPWYWAYLQYSRKIPIGSVIARLNYSHRFDIDGLQFETDAYLNTGKSNYIYLNAGISDGNLFPKYRFGFEFYQSLPKSFEASLGFRQLWFSSSNVTIYTGSLGKYWKKYWFSIRAYVTPSGGRTSFTEVFQTRRYFGDRENYLGLQYSHGSSPDDIHKFLDNADKLRLKSDKVKLTYNRRFAVFWIYQICGAYEREEYYPTLFRNKYTIDLTLERIF